MEQHRDEGDEAQQQLLLALHTSGVDDTSLSRRWIGLGLVLVVLWGVVGIMLVIGHRTQETPNTRSPLVSSAHDPASQGQLRDLNDWAPWRAPPAGSQQGTRPPDTPPEVLRPAVVPPALGARAGPAPGSASASPRAKLLNTHPRLMKQPKHQAACPGKGCLSRVSRRRQIPPAQGSLLDEFDPNAVLVRSTP